MTDPTICPTCETPATDFNVYYKSVDYWRPEHWSYDAETERVTLDEGYDKSEIIDSYPAEFECAHGHCWQAGVPYEYGVVN